MSVGNVTPIKPGDPENYTVTVQHKPASPGDPIPWFVTVEQDKRYVGGGWNGTRDEAIERACEIIAADSMLGEPETLTMTPGGELA